MGRFLLISLFAAMALAAGAADDLERQFTAPPDSARPWVYWMVMDGNLTREGITADLESMKKAGIGGVIFMEVGIGIPRGPVEFMSPEWRVLLKHAAAEADRLGLELSLAAGPGWCGTGGPWIKPEQSMQHLVSSEVTVQGPARHDAILPRPQPRTPFFGAGTLTPELAKAWKDFYVDVAVLAFPTPAGSARIADVDEKALYYRAPYSSRPGVRPFMPEPAEMPLPAAECIAPEKIVDLTGKLGPDGRLAWDVPEGSWTIMRLGRTITGQTTRPAPAPGLGLESDKFDREAADAHFKSFTATLLETIGPERHEGRGLTTLHFDSWEMSSQNWSGKFRAEFQKRRGYDPLPYLPAMSGRVVKSAEISERFLWDLRQTAQELVVENHTQRLKELAHQNGLKFSIEPYDLNPTSDLNLGGVADVPMCEFWSSGFGFNSAFSCIEAVSAAHTMGRPVVGAEAFTASAQEAWQQYPGRMKAQGDWAFCAGVNRFVFHRSQHQPWLDRFPGMTMGPYGVHWERTETWWEMVPAYHAYLSRCQQMLRRGLAVADILYLAPEGAPHVFRPPASATTGGDTPDRLGYNFDGCAPEALVAHATVRDGRIAFPDGMSYRVLVLPEFETMTPGLLRKIAELAEAGATVIGAPPRKSPSLSGYPKCDEEVRQWAARLWGEGTPQAERAVGKGKLIYDPSKPKATPTPSPTPAPAPATAAPKKKKKAGARPAPAAVAYPDLYPSYEMTAQVLRNMGVPQDFESDGNLRYTHRLDGDADIYFVANRDGQPAEATCRFRAGGRAPEWWDPLTGERRDLPEFSEQGGVTAVPLRLDAFGSGFVVFRKPAPAAKPRGRNLPGLKTVLTVDGPWAVAFDPRWGGPEKAAFAALDDWSKRPEPGIRNYSGKAVYRTELKWDGALPSPDAGKLFINLGDVKNLASVRLNGRELGAVWCAPWRVEIPAGALKQGPNALEITVANLWINRLIGDAGLPQEKRLTWTTWSPYKPDSPLQPSGLLGPVTLQSE